MNFIEQMPVSWQEKWEALGFEKPSAIQEQSFQPLKEKQTVLGISPTGTGKTLAYVWPLLLNVQANKGPQLLILAPSQELAVQINQVVKTWADLLDLRTQSLIGGANVKRQVEKLKQKPEILVGTPGRIWELIKLKKIKSHLLETIVLDEVDQLLDSTEFNLTQKIMQSAPKDFQLVFYSATADRVQEKVQALAPAVVICHVTDELEQPQATHHFIKVSTRKKVDLLRRFSHMPAFYSIVFFNQVAELGSAQEKLLYLDLPIVGLASDQTKLLRKFAVEQFATRHAHLLLTTEVAARGLDFPELPYVVNADVPLSPESYLHRAGRVGRMGASGQVITLVTDAATRDYQRLMKSLGFKAQELFVYGGALQEERPAKSIDKARATTTNKKKNNHQAPKNTKAKPKAKRPIKQARHKG